MLEENKLRTPATQGHVQSEVHSAKYARKSSVMTSNSDYFTDVSQRADGLLSDNTDTAELWSQPRGDYFARGRPSQTATPASLRTRLSSLAQS